MDTLTRAEAQPTGEGRRYLAKWSSICAHCHKPIQVGANITWFPAPKGGASAFVFHGLMACPLVATVPPASDAPNAGLREFTARWSGKCDGCGKRTNAGDQILYAKGVGQFHVGHENMALSTDDTETFGEGPDLTTLPIGTTRYAVADSTGKLQFIRVDHIDPADDANRWAGHVFVKVQYGDREDERLGRQKPGEVYKGIWRSMLTAILGDPDAAARRYGLEIGRCSRCDRTLTDPQSRALGIGPVCREIYGLKAEAVVPGQEGLEL